MIGNGNVPVRLPSGHITSANLWAWRERRTLNISRPRLCLFKSRVYTDTNTPNISSSRASHTVRIFEKINLVNSSEFFMVQLRVCTIPFSVGYALHYGLFNIKRHTLDPYIWPLSSFMLKCYINVLNSFSYHFFKKLFLNSFISHLSNVLLILL